MKKILAFVFFLVFFIPCAFSADTYVLDKAHSSIGFSIAHMMVARTSGGFNDFDAQIRFDPADPANSVFDVSISASSIDTRHAQRDAHLRGVDFFDAGQYPRIIFKTRKVVRQEGNNYIVTGDLEMKGVTRQIEVPVVVLGPLENPVSGKMTIGIEAYFRLDRQDYGITWNKTLDNGGFLVGNEVQASVLLEVQRQ